MLPVCKADNERVMPQKGQGIEKNNLKGQCIFWERLMMIPKNINCPNRIISLDFLIT